MSSYQYLREAQLLVANQDQALDLSGLRFKFQIKAADVESPTNAWIRVYNLSNDTIQLIRPSFTRVILEAGYQGNRGVIFDGTIKQFRIGRESSTDNYLDLLAADGDLAYNYAVVNRTLAAGSSTGDRINATVDAMKRYGVQGQQILLPETGGVLPRGKVLFGMARHQLRIAAQSVGATWSIHNGKVTVVPKAGYKPDQVVVLNGQTGLIGRPEQTVDGIRARALINPSIQIGGRVQIDNAAINQTLQADPDAAPVPFNQWAGLQLFANIASDGIYRVYVIEYDGDTRGQEWYADLTLLAIDPASNKVVSP